MSESSISKDPPASRDADNWAQTPAALRVSSVPAGALNLNVDGRRVAGPLQGFGPLWQKTYQVRLSGADVTPAEVIQVWKAEFPKFQPRTNRFYPAVTGVQPGEIVLLNATLRGLPVNGGVMVLYADDESFTLMTPEGMPEAGWIMCSAYVEEGCTVAQVQTQGRSNDPIFEIGFRVMGATEQENIWSFVLTSLAERFGVNGQVVVRKSCLDPRIRWAGVRNIWQNAALRSMIYLALHPARLFRKSAV